MGYEKNINSGYFPMINKIGRKGFFVVSASMGIAFLLIIFAGNPIFKSIYRVPENYQSIFVVFDSFIFQMLAGVHCMACLYWWKVNTTSRKLFATYLPVFVIIILIIFISFLINDFVYKELIDIERPKGSRLSIGIISQFFSTVSEKGAPSGYASRGVILFLAALLAGLGKIKAGTGWVRAISDTKWITSIQAILLVATCMSRVLTGYHFWFDISLGLALGILTFWTVEFYLILSERITGFDNKVKRESLEAINALLITIIVGFSLIGLFYASRLYEWFSGVILMTILILYSYNKIVRNVKRERTFFFVDKPKDIK